MIKTKLLAVSAFTVALGMAMPAFAQYGDSPGRSNTNNGTSPNHSSVGQYLDDASITAKVKAALFSDSQLKATNVSVQTNDGTVQLTGTVPSAAEKSKAETDANRVDGVKSVQDLLNVRSSQDE